MCYHWSLSLPCHMNPVATIPYFLQVLCNVILPFTPSPSKWFLSFRFPHQIPYMHFYSPTLWATYCEPHTVSHILWATYPAHFIFFDFITLIIFTCQSQWLRGLRRRSEATHLLRLWVWIPPGAWISVCCECCVLSGSGLCNELITRTEESYRLCCVFVCDIETSRMGAPYIWH